LKMRKVLIIALGLASLGAIAGVQPAAAALGSCRLAAADAARNCTYNPKTGQKVCAFSQTSYDTTYNRCVAAQAAAIGQSKALTTAKPGPDIQQGKKTHPN
jgi:hypothetical protein